MTLLILPYGSVSPSKFMPVCSCIPYQAVEVKATFNLFLLTRALHVVSTCRPSFARLSWREIRDFSNMLKLSRPGKKKFDNGVSHMQSWPRAFTFSKLPITIGLPDQKNGDAKLLLTCRFTLQLFSEACIGTSFYGCCRWPKV